MMQTIGKYKAESIWSWINWIEQFRHDMALGTWTTVNINGHIHLYLQTYIQLQHSVKQLTYTYSYCLSDLQAIAAKSTKLSKIAAWQRYQIQKYL